MKARTEVLTLNGGWKALFRIIMVLLPLVLTAQLAIDGWMFKEILSVREWVAKTEADRFTSKDGLAVWKSIAQCKQDVAVLATRLGLVERGESNVE